MALHLVLKEMPLYHLGEPFRLLWDGYLGMLVGQKTLCHVRFFLFDLAQARFHVIWCNFTTRQSINTARALEPPQRQRLDLGHPIMNRHGEWPAHMPTVN